MSEENAAVQAAHDELARNPQAIEALAAKLPDIVSEQIGKLFDERIAEKTEAARQEIDRTGATDSAVAQVEEQATAPDNGGRIAEMLADFQKGGGQLTYTWAERFNRAGLAPGRVALAAMDREQSAEYVRCVFANPHTSGGQPDQRLDANGLITQALTSISSSAGGYLMPDDFYAEVSRKADEPAVIWPILTKRPTRSRTVKQPEITTYASANTGTDANVNSATTATEITATEPVFSEVEWNLEDADTRFPVKLDLLEESAVNLYDQLIWSAADAFAIKHERFPFLGRGHTTYQEPLGVLDSTAGITEVSISAAPTVANVLNFCQEIPQRYRAAATVFMPATTLYAVAEALATDVNAPQYLMSFLPPMKESAYVTEGKMVGGDWRRYIVYYIRLMQVVTSIAAERKTQEVVVTETWTGKPVLTDAFRIGTGITYT